VEALAADLLSRKATCNGLVWSGGADADLDNLGEVAVFLCSDIADGITGQTLVMTD
jgi:enoyl-[acyl-carrier-protein] reductase (NADH)